MPSPNHAGPLSALVIVAPMISRVQHSRGSHEQDMISSQAIASHLQLDGYPRCTCDKCLTLWGKPGLADAGTRVGDLLRARAEVEARSQLGLWGDR